MLNLHGQSVFAHAISSFSALFTSVPFLFIAWDVVGTQAFLQAECAALGIASFRIAMLAAETAGQAETVGLGLDMMGVDDKAALTIFNIDTFRASFSFPIAPWFTGSDGYLEVFRGSGANWSYLGPAAGAAEPLVARTTEKQPISDLCCDGLYHFAQAGDFRAALAAERAKPSLPELYVAPLYNDLIEAGRRIQYDVAPAQSITFCGVPTEYEAACAGTPIRV